MNIVAGGWLGRRLGPGMCRNASRPELEIHGSHECLRHRSSCWDKGTLPKHSSIHLHKVCASDPNTRIIGWGIRFKLQMLFPQEDE